MNIDLYIYWLKGVEMFGQAGDAKIQDATMVSDQSFNDMAGGPITPTMPSYQDVPMQDPGFAAPQVQTAPTVTGQLPEAPVQDDSLTLPVTQTTTPPPIITNSRNGSYIAQSGTDTMEQPSAPPLETTPAPVAQPAPAATTEPPASETTNPELLSVKQQALAALTPLIGHIDQTPAERFRTLMMMIQAADDHTLIPSALAAAHEITDDKERAQALLDIINEVNYFTQQKSA